MISRVQKLSYCTVNIVLYLNDVQMVKKKIEVIDVTNGTDSIGKIFENDLRSLRS